MTTMTDREIAIRRSRAVNRFVFSLLYALPAAVPPVQWIFCMFGSLKSLMNVILKIKNQAFAFVCGVLFWSIQISVPTLIWIYTTDGVHGADLDFQSLALKCVGFSFFMNYVVGQWILNRIRWLEID